MTPDEQKNAGESVSLRDHFDMKIGDLRGYFSERLDALEDHLAETTNDIRILRESKAMLEGKASQTSVIVAMLTAAIGIALAVVGLLVRTGRP